MYHKPQKTPRPPCSVPGSLLACLILLSLLWAPLSYAQDGYRNWTDRQGREITAKLISQNSSSVTLRSDEGKVRRIPKENFSSADRAYLEGLMDNQQRGQEQTYTEETELAEPQEQAQAPREPEPATAATADAEPNKNWEEEVQEVAQSVGGDTQAPDGPEPVADKPEESREPLPAPQTQVAREEPDNSTKPSATAQAEDSPAHTAGPDSSDYAAVTGAGAAETTMDVQPQPGDNSVQNEGLPTEPDMPEDIPYKTVDEWDLPNKEGGGRRIIISPKNADAETLRHLGQQLMIETEGEVYTDIEVFTSAEAANLAKENVQQLNLEDRAAFERHYVAHYHKNVAQNLVQYELFPARPGAEEIVDLN